MQEKGSAAFTVKYEFASRTKPFDEFMSKYKGNYTFTGGKTVANEIFLACHGRFL